MEHFLVVEQERGKLGPPFCGGQIRTVGPRICPPLPPPPVCDFRPFSYQAMCKRTVHQYYSRIDFSIVASLQVDISDTQYLIPIEI
eukprot:SAG11_NODE_205_length_12427_cov_8.010140_10_plen_86_part_00